MELNSILPVILASMVSIAYAALGEVLIERSGILNLSIEGVLAAGALTAFWINYQTGEFLLSVGSVILVGASWGTILALFMVWRVNNQILIGLIGAFLLVSVTNHLGQPYVNTVAPKAPHDYWLWLLLPLTAAAGYFLSHTTWGLQLRAVGEAPEECYANGIKVNRIRTLTLIAGCILMALGGAQLELVMVRGIWVNNLVSGRGWIAYAVTVFSGWNPKLALLGALMFGAATTSQFALQSWGVDIPSSLLSGLPYVLALMAYLFSLSSQPAALSEPWQPTK
ncbi:MAG: ABC transporter permease [Anaerolineales bacterium]|nr:ABC transporter permease [Anaerolineales bacterium]